MNATDRDLRATESRRARQFRRAIRKAAQAWSALRRVEAALHGAWEACTDEERQGICDAERILMPRDAHELFRDLGA
jgi:hypothetical protein